MHGTWNLNHNFRGSFMILKRQSFMQLVCTFGNTILWDNIFDLIQSSYIFPKKLSKTFLDLSSIYLQFSFKHKISVVFCVVFRQLRTSESPDFEVRSFLPRSYVTFAPKLGHFCPKVRLFPPQLDHFCP